MKEASRRVLSGDEIRAIRKEGKKITSPLGVYCNTCRLYTQSEAPVMIKRINQKDLIGKVDVLVCKKFKI